MYIFHDADKNLSRVQKGSLDTQYGWSNSSAKYEDVTSTMKRAEDAYRKIATDAITFATFKVVPKMRVIDEAAVDLTYFIPPLEKVIFNPPATIAMWKDGTKTVVKCGGEDAYSEEHGLAMCIAKKYFRSRSAMLKAVRDAKRPQKKV